MKIDQIDFSIPVDNRELVLAFKLNELIKAHNDLVDKVEQNSVTEQPQEGTWTWALSNLKLGLWVKRANFVGSMYMQEGKFYLFNPFGEDLEFTVDVCAGFTCWEIDELEGGC